MPLAPPPLVDATAPVRRPYPEPRILWPTFHGHGDGGGSDSGRFPRLNAIKARLGACQPEALSAFVEAARMARDRILVLDEFLFDPEKDDDEKLRQRRCKQILSWLPYHLIANDVRFLTKECAGQWEIQKLFNGHVAVINRYSPRRLGRANIEIRFSLKRTFPYVHDRFAVIDSELWHFGATVGGLHRQVNAATRGWDAEAHDAVRFFNEAWEGDSDFQRGGRRG